MQEWTKIGFEEGTDTKVHDGLERMTQARDRFEVGQTGWQFNRIFSPTNRPPKDG